MELWDFQQKAKSDLYRLFKSNILKVVLVAPTGSGKTVMSSSIITDAVARNRKVLFVVHRDELAKQAAQTLAEFGIMTGFIIANIKPTPLAKVQITSVQTMGRRDPLEIAEGFDLIVFDEAHITAWSTAGKLLLGKENTFILGLTATPWRLSKYQEMGDLFDGIVHAPMPSELIEKGFLAKPKYYSLSKPDLTGVRLGSDGDYRESDLNIACNTPSTILNLVTNWKEYGNNQPTIIFGVSVSHAQNIAESFNNAGIPADFVTGETSKNDRKTIFNNLRTGQIKILTSCDVLSEGFDYKGVGCVILARPTKSKAKYFQQLGRGLRSDKGKVECIILDQAGLVNSFGLVEELQPPQLIKSPEKKPGKTGICEGCGRKILPTIKLCPKCAPAKIKEIIDENQLMSEIATGEKRQFLFYREKMQFAYHKRYKPEWAGYEYGKQFNQQWPKSAYMLGSVFLDPSPKNQKLYFNYLDYVAMKKDENREWIQRWFKAQFGFYAPPELFDSAPSKSFRERL